GEIGGFDCCAAHAPGSCKRSAAAATLPRPPGTPGAIEEPSGALQAGRFVYSPRVTVDRARLRSLLAQERTRFRARHPRSRELFERARASPLRGVPMHWMVRSPGDFPIFVEAASAAHFTDVAGHRSVDLFLG